MRARRWIGAAASPLRAPLIAAAVILTGGAIGPVIGLDRATIRDAGNRSLLRDYDTCPYDIGLQAVRGAGVPDVVPTDGSPPLATVDTITNALDHAVGGAVPPPVVTLLGGVFTLVDDGTQRATPVQLISRTGAEGNLDPSSSPAKPDPAGSLIVQDMTAKALGIQPGTRVHLTTRTGTAPLVVKRVADNLDNGGFPTFWCSLAPQIYGSSAHNISEYPMVIVDQTTLLAVEKAVGQSAVTAIVEYAPRRSTWSLATAPRVLAGLNRVRQRARNDTDPLGQAITPDGQTTVDVLHTVGIATSEMVAAEGVVRPFTILALALLLACLCLCVVIWVQLGDRGRRVLVRHGMGAIEIFIMSVAELAPAAVIAGVVGLISRLLVLRHVDPHEQHPLSSIATPGWATVAAGLLPLVTVAAIAALRSRALAKAEQPRRPWAAIAAGAGLSVAAVSSYSAYRTRVHTATSRHGFTGTDNLSALTIAIIAVLIPLALTSPVLVDRIWTRPRRRSNTIWLAWMRARSDRPLLRALTVCISAATSLVLLVAVSRTAVDQASSVRSTIGLGAHLVYTLDTEPDASLVALEAQMTVVSRLREPSVLSGAKPPVDVLGVDPDTFARAALWQDTFSDQSLRSLLKRLDDPSDPSAALVIGDGVPETFRVTVPGDRTNVTLTVHAVARPALFPSLEPSRDRPLVVVNRALLLGNASSGGVQLWSSSTKPLPSTTVTALGLETAAHHSANIGSVVGAITVLHSLRLLRVLVVAALIALAATIALAVRSARLGAGRRELAVLALLGVRPAKIVGSFVASTMIVAFIGIVSATIATTVVNLTMPYLADQTPFLVSASTRVWVFAPLLAAFGAAAAVSLCVASMARRRLRPDLPYEEVVHHG